MLGLLIFLVLKQLVFAAVVLDPEGGCWEITGTVGNATLTFVTFVRRT